MEPAKPHLNFDVASIHEARDGDTSYIDNMPRTSFYHAERVPVCGLILGAYDIHLIQLIQGLPPWGMTTRYVVTAKSDPSTDEALAKLSDADSYSEKRYMLRSVLADRFKLKIHSETRPSTTYELVATNRTAKLMTPVQGDVAKTVSSCNMHYPPHKGMDVESKGCPFPILLSTIQQELGTEVADHTGLTGMYAYHLMWRPSSVTPQNDEDWFPSIVDAVREQLGLELKRTKGPVTFWVVDHVEHPTPN